MPPPVRLERRRRLASSLRMRSPSPLNHNCSCRSRWERFALLLGTPRALNDCGCTLGGRQREESLSQKGKLESHRARVWNIGAGRLEHGRGATAKGIDGLAHEFVVGGSTFQSLLTRASSPDAARPRRWQRAVVDSYRRNIWSRNQVRNVQADQSGESGPVGKSVAEIGDHARVCWVRGACRRSPLK